MNVRGYIRIFCNIYAAQKCPYQVTCEIAQVAVWHSCQTSSVAQVFLPVHILMIILVHIDQFYQCQDIAHALFTSDDRVPTYLSMSISTLTRHKCLPIPSA